MTAHAAVSAADTQWNCFEVTIEAGVAHIRMTRPEAPTSATVTAPRWTGT
jgi:hypothetical protein